MTFEFKVFLIVTLIKVFLIVTLMVCASMISAAIFEVASVCRRELKRIADALEQKDKS